MKTIREERPALFEAGCWYRDRAGNYHRPRRRGPSKTAAKNKLQAELNRLSTAATGGKLTPQTRFGKVAELYFEELDRLVAQGSKSPTTRDHYQHHWNRNINKALGNVLAGELEADVSIAHDFLVDLARRTPAGAKTCRSVLSNICRYGVPRGAFGRNPVRDLGEFAAPPKRRKRSLTAAEALDWLKQVDAHTKAQRWHIGDLSRLMCGTSVRISEALALSWDDVDLERATIAFEWRIIYVRGEGIRRVKNLKRESGDRVMRVPRWTVSMLRKRKLAATPGVEPVFPDRLGGWRDPSNTRRVLRDVRDEAGFPWLTTHTFRRSVATILDRGGASAAAVAAQLGHTKVAQSHEYMDRQVVNEGNVAILERFALGGPAESASAESGQ